MRPARLRGQATPRPRNHNEEKNYKDNRENGAPKVTVIELLFSSSD
jgi:hypothetical protein